MDLNDIAPKKVMIAGDWHMNVMWACSAVRQGAARLDGEEKKVILQLGDFGIWHGKAGKAYLDDLEYQLLRADAWLFFLDGNHENHRLLARAADGGKAGEAVPFTSRIWHLPRGYRWKWHDRTWLALGGAASVDRAFRTEGHSWFREEEITLLQAAMAVLPGPAEVMLTHECPRKVTQTLPLGEPPAGWDLEVSRSHQELLDRVVCHAEPSHLFHGHMHLAHRGTFGYPHGKVQVAGLGCDGQQGNWEIYDTELMAWEEEADDQP
jgi:hypothetical protein